LSPVPLLECTDIAFERDDIPLFSGVSLRLLPGQAIQIKGANGVGKTTLLRILSTSLQSTSGVVMWKGKPLSGRLSEFRADSLYIGHASGVKLALSPVENLRWFFRVFPGNGVAISDALRRVGLAGFEDVPCNTLSAGQLRRVALARLYASAATLWILDEPLTSIDVDGVDMMAQLMGDHLAAGNGILMTSHQPLPLENLHYLELEDYVH